MSRVCIMSLWRNDADRSLESRVAHLTDKDRHTDHEVSYLWLVGDTYDTTTRDLIDTGRRFRPDGAHINIYESQSGVEPGEDVATHRRRFASNASDMFAEIRDDVDYVILHESDIKSPLDLVDQLLAVPPSRLPCAAWPVLEREGRDQFYDIWAFKHLNGEPFAPWNRPPKGTFEVSSFGTVWVAPADLVRGRVLSELCVVDLCNQWRSEGVRLWVNPTVIVRQPAALWTLS